MQLMAWLLVENKLRELKSDYYLIAGGGAKIKPSKCMGD